MEQQKVVIYPNKQMGGCEPAIVGSVSAVLTGLMARGLQVFQQSTDRVVWALARCPLPFPASMSMASTITREHTVLLEGIRIQRSSANKNLWLWIEGVHSESLDFVAHFVGRKSCQVEVVGP